MADETENETEIEPTSAPPAQSSKRRKQRAPENTPDATEDALAAIMATLPEPDPAEGLPASTPELHQVESLIAAARSILEVAPEVLAGAMHAAGIDQTSDITIEQARAALGDYLKQSI